MGEISSDLIKSISHEEKDLWDDLNEWDKFYRKGESERASEAIYRAYIHAKRIEENRRLLEMFAEN